MFENVTHFCYSLKRIVTKNYEVFLSLLKYVSTKYINKLYYLFFQFNLE